MKSLVVIGVVGAMGCNQPLMEAVDLAGSLDFGAQPDLAGPLDLESSPDQARPIDLETPPDLMAPPDLTLWPLGRACVSAAECQSGLCVDGLCCDTPCTGNCSACSVAGMEGTCSPILAGTAPLSGHGTCSPTPASSCGHDGSCDGAGQCHVWAQGTQCAPPGCNAMTGWITGVSSCDGSGTCVAPQPVSCGSYVCADATACATRCTDNTLCTAGHFCVGGACQLPTCTDGLMDGSETDIDCGGPDTCPRCDGGQGCMANTDCLSGTCAMNACTAPTYMWNTGPFDPCAAPACSQATQSRMVWCTRNDGAIVSDAFCGAGRPSDTQACVNSMGCTWVTGMYGPCSARCDGGTMTRAVYCTDAGGQQVPDMWCATQAPATTLMCNVFPCVVYVADFDANCWAGGNCLGGYPAYPNCPAGYAPTRSEIACGNPNSCNGNWALCTFYMLYGFGCLNPNYVMAVSSRECTYL